MNGNTSTGSKSCVNRIYLHVHARRFDIGRKSSLEESCIQPTAVVHYFFEFFSRPLTDLHRMSVILIVIVWENRNTHRLAFSNTVSDLYHTCVCTVRTTSLRLSEFSPSRREINSLIPLLSSLSTQPIYRALPNPTTFPHSPTQGPQPLPPPAPLAPRLPHIFPGPSLATSTLPARHSKRRTGAVLIIRSEPLIA